MTSLKQLAAKYLVWPEWAKIAPERPISNIADLPDDRLVAPSFVEPPPIHWMGLWNADYVYDPGDGVYLNRVCYRCKELTMIRPDGKDAHYHWERIVTPAVVEVPEPAIEPRYWPTETHTHITNITVVRSRQGDSEFPGGDVVLKADYDLMRKTLMQEIKVYQMMAKEAQ
jgi:hypothetical protein